MCPDQSPESLADSMTAQQRVKACEWLESDPLLTALAWSLGLVWCLIFWGALAWWFDLLPNWSWL